MKFVILIVLVAAGAIAVAMSSATQGVERDAPAAPEPYTQPGARFPVTINRPSGPPRLLTDEVDVLGRQISVACSTCHTTRDPNTQNAITPDLDEFHQDLTMEHASLSCLSCHNDEDYDTLKRAGGEPIEYQNVMHLCGQCHGTKYRDYLHGAHGGMSGYWDLTKGPRVRNNCVDCHDPHAPAYPQMTPTFKPIDRFLTDRHDESAADPHDGRGG